MFLTRFKLPWIKQDLGELNGGDGRVLGCLWIAVAVCVGWKMNEKIVCHQNSPLETKALFSTEDRVLRTVPTYPM